MEASKWPTHQDMIKWELSCDVSTSGWCEQTAPSKLLLTRHLSTNNRISCSLLFTWNISFETSTLQGYFCALNPLDVASDKQNFSANNCETNISSSFSNVVQGKSSFSCVLDYLVLTSKAKAGSAPGWNISQEGWGPAGTSPGPPTGKGCSAGGHPQFQPHQLQSTLRVLKTPLTKQRIPRLYLAT